MAGGSIIGALRVILGIDSGLFEKGLTDAEKRFAKFGAGLQKAGAAIAGVLSVGAIVALTKSAAAYGASLDDMSQRLGINVEKLQELAYAASLAGVSQEDFGKALEQMNKRLGEVKAGNTAASDSLGKLGLTLADIKGKTPDEVFKILAERISRVKDPMQQAALSAEFFSKTGAKLLPVLKEGAAGLNKYAEEARRLGFILSDETIAKAAKADDEFERIGKSLKVAGVNLTSGLLPGITALREVMTSQAFQDGVKEFGKNLGEAVKWMVDNKQTILQVSAALAGAWAGAKVGRLAGGGGAVVGAGLGAVGGLIGAGEPDRAPTRITVNAKPRGGEPEIDPDAANKARILAESMRELQFKTQLARGEFQLLAEGFPEAAHGMKLFGEKGAEGRVTLDLLSPALQRLNQQLLLFKGAQLQQENLAPWDAYEQKLMRIQQLLDAQAISTDTAARAQRKLAVEAGTAWDIAGASIAGSISDAAGAFGAENKKMARISQIAGGFQAVISMWTGAAKALELPFPANIAAWATVLATGAKAVSAIKGQKLPAFAGGGAMRVPGMFSGTDSQLLQARVSPGEQIDIWRPGEGPDQRRGAGGGPMQEIVFRFDEISRPMAEKIAPALSSLLNDRGITFKVA